MLFHTSVGKTGFTNHDFSHFTLWTQKLIKVKKGHLAESKSENLGKDKNLIYQLS